MERVVSAHTAAHADAAARTAEGHRAVLAARRAALEAQQDAHIHEDEASDGDAGVDGVSEVSADG